MKVEDMHPNQQAETPNAAEMYLEIVKQSQYKENDTSNPYKMPTAFKNLPTNTTYGLIVNQNID